jgi:nucleotide-binding universal stress UspA family protein
MPIIRRILVPTDFSDTATRALEHAIDAAHSFRASVLLLHVHSAPVIAMPDGGMISIPIPDELAIRAQLEEGLAKLAAEVKSRGVSAVGTLLLEGSPWREILRASSERSCDLIVMGTHGRGGLGRLVLGSVAEQVMRAASCPVLAIGPNVAAPARRAVAA